MSYLYYFHSPNTLNAHVHLLHTQCSHCPHRHCAITLVDNDGGVQWNGGGGDANYEDRAGGLCQLHEGAYFIKVGAVAKKKNLQDVWIALDDEEMYDSYKKTLRAGTLAWFTQNDGMIDDDNDDNDDNDGMIGPFEMKEDANFNDDSKKPVYLRFTSKVEVNYARGNRDIKLKDGVSL